MIILGTNSIKDTGFDVANSARFNSSSSDSLTRTQSASPTHDDKGTLSFWFKRSLLGVDQYVFSVFQDSNNRMQMNIKDDDQLKLIQKTGGSTIISLITNRVFRDVSAWMNIVVAIDTTQGTASNRIKIYINGVQETSFGTETYPSQNENVFLTKGTAVSLGAYDSGASGHTSAYFSEIVMVDGQQLAADQFGEFDSDSGIWKPIDVSGLTFGNNGFYLDFEDSSALGNDAAGSNNFTVNNLTAIDQSTDTCTNNFATWNSLQPTNATMSEGNLVGASSPSSGHYSGISSIGVSSGKWYFECKQIQESTSNEGMIGVIIIYDTITALLNPVGRGGGWGLQDGTRGFSTDSSGNGSTTDSFHAGWDNNDTIGIALDIDNSRVYFSKNGQWNNSGSWNASTPTTSQTLQNGLGDGTYFFMAGDASGSNNNTWSANFGSPAHAISSGNTDADGYGNFEYAVPSGYFSLNTKKPSGVWIMSYTNGLDKPSNYFVTKLYTGNGGTNAQTGVGFAPNWVWIKNRSGADNNALYDTIRGANKVIVSNNTNAEGSQSDGLTAFGTDGFTVGADGAVNTNGNNFVAWNWKAGTSVSGNTGGSGTAKTYTGSVNTDAGFSIIRYIGNSTAGHTIPHHLGTTPAWIICRTISAAKEWDVYHHKLASSPESDYIVLNTNAAAAGATDAADKWNDTAPTSSVVTLGDSSQLNTNDGTCIMYAFAEKQGYSKFGSYTGNGNADGAFIYTGQKSAFIMLKNTTRAASWLMFDNKRLGYNVDNNEVVANTSAAEETYDHIDFLSNGFKMRANGTSTNLSGDTYIYMAFAENPFVTSTGVPATAR